MDAVCSTELFDACDLLFGPGIHVSRNWLNYLQPSGLKAAYRKKALETHPDRARVLGQDRGQLEESFQQINRAYEKLNAALSSGTKVFVPTPKPARQKTREQTRSSARTEKRSEYFFSGHMPARKLLIGQFLFYSGLISWNSYIRSIIWQRKQRPAVGRIAREWGMLSENEIKTILIRKDAREKFGDSAVRRGFLNVFQLYAILGKQRRLQTPIGEYFIQRQFLNRFEVTRMVTRQTRHNSQFPLI